MWEWFWNQAVNRGWKTASSLLEEAQNSLEWTVGLGDIALRAQKEMRACYWKLELVMK